MINIPNVDELAAKIAKERADNALADAKARAAHEKARKALLEKLSHPSGLSEDQFLQKAAALINRAVENRQSSVEVFRFPNTICTDNGRAINQAEAGWERTLIGEPKEIYECWEHQLKPRGYRIRFQILDYPGGMPGDVVVTLSWQTEQADQK